ncbi:MULTISPECIES: cytochrome P450 [Mycobacterium avium complex (MAC)]|uniref:cytochrome P450 n=1 Tax=Mycobacterium avium complex (MAC) TaxID=120793 RepID=UPI0004BC4377|nr:cytochrome P450 [Mycobacterium intracellulare]MCA2276728.1 cytochrome P450 [Mycobacterium intracellulare]UEB24840.1 cytochrome P450 [Mycobacterium intracellulare]BCP23745.1 cytochrome P450 [Mycobacterium intracellulare]
MSHSERPSYFLDNTDPEVLRRLPETLTELPDRCPVAWSEFAGGFWALSKYDDVSGAANDWATYSAARGIMIPPTGASMPVIPAELDPPKHTKLRKLMIPHFTDRALAPWREGIAKIIAEAFEPLLPLGEADLVKDIAHPVPVLVISMILGIDSDWRTIRELAANFLDATGNPTLARQRARELEAFLEEQIDQRRGEEVTDLLGTFVNSEVDGEPIPATELLGLVQLTVVAGHETTVNGIASMIYRLVTEPGLRERLLADRDLTAPFIDEVLRLNPPVWNMARTVVQEAQVRGESLCPGEKVMLVYGAANRDPEVFADPQKFDIDRPGVTKHLSFGSGRHRCIGEPLAKAELRLTLDYVLDNVPNIEMAGEPEWGGGTNQFGLRSLPVRFNRST